MKRTNQAVKIEQVKIQEEVEKPKRDAGKPAVNYKKLIQETQKVMKEETKPLLKEEKKPIQE